MYKIRDCTRDSRTVAVSVYTDEWECLDILQRVQNNRCAGSVMVRMPTHFTEGCVGDGKKKC